MKPSILIFPVVFFISALSAQPPPRTAEGYRIPQPGQVFYFPRDHGSHPDFLLEWWYLTGHLTDENGEDHGFQLTFFRRALQPDSEQAAAPGPFGRDHLHMAHAAWTSPGRQTFHREERLARNGWDAGASTHRLDVHQGGWRLTARSKDPNPVMDTMFSVDNRVRALMTFTPQKPFVQFGVDGVERKGDDPSAASHYITWTRLQVNGTVEIDGRPLQVTGTAWMDHEISSSQLDDDQVGWDWASIQLDDGQDMMLYILRTADGGISPHSVLYWISTEGDLTQVPPDQFTWEALNSWESEESGAVYPLDWRLEVNDPGTGQPVTLRVRPRMLAQEHTGILSGIPYWEGLCSVWKDGRRAGRAYVELTGYADSLRDAVR